MAQPPQKLLKTVEWDAIPDPQNCFDFFEDGVLLLLCQLDAAGGAIHHPAQDLLPHLPQAFALVQLLQRDGLLSTVARDIRRRKHAVNAVQQCSAAVPERFPVACLCHLHKVINVCFQHVQKSRTLLCRHAAGLWEAHFNVVEQGQHPFLKRVFRQCAHFLARASCSHIVCRLRGCTEKQW